MRLYLLGVLLAFVCGQYATAQTIFAIGSGDWDETAIWSATGIGGSSCGCLPGSGDNVLIDGFDVDIDGSTGDVVVSSVVLANTTGTDVRLRVQGGSSLTVTGSFEITNSSSGRDAELSVMGTDSELIIQGDFLASQTGGDDLLIDIDDNSTVNISGNASFEHDGGDDLELNINFNSGIAAEWNVVGDLNFEHNAGDDIRVRVDDASSLLHVEGDFEVNMNAGADDDFTFNLDDGDLIVDGDLRLSRVLSTAFISLDMDGGNVSCDSLILSSSGVTANGEIRLFFDQNSVLNCNWLTADVSGGDDLLWYMNTFAGTEAEVTVANDVIANWSGGNDLDIELGQDNSSVTIGGDLRINQSGGGDFSILLDNNSTWQVDGDFEIETTGGNGGDIILSGGSDDPTLGVNGNFSWLNNGGFVDVGIDLNSGTFNVGNDFSLINGPGADDIDLLLDDDAVLTIGGDFLAEITGGDDIRIGMGETVLGSTAQINVAGNASVLLSSNSAVAPFWYVHVYENTRFIVGQDLTLGTDFTTTGLCLFIVNGTSELDVDGDIDLNAIGSGELELRLDDDSFLRIGGNFLRAPAPNDFGEFDASGGNGTVEYRGDGPQVIARNIGGGGDDFRYMNLTINNSFGTSPQLTLEGDVTVHGNLSMNDGIVVSGLSDALILADNATSTGGSNASYVSGYMRKIGNDAFTFPVGDGGFYAPIGISAPTGITDAFEARYYFAIPHDAGYDSSMHDPSVNHISKTEYWELNRSSGTANPTVTVSWDTPRSGGVINEADLRFMYWNGFLWRDLGISALTGTPANGSLANSIGITSYTFGLPITLGTVDAINPLPIDLLDFQAALQNGQVNVNWTTASEINTANFQVERSADGIVWKLVGNVPAAGNSSIFLSYELIDRLPLPGISYYRLKQVDNDGEFVYYAPVSVLNESGLHLYPNPANEQLTVRAYDFESIPQVYTMQGKKVNIGYFQLGEKIVLETHSLSPGTYTLIFGEKVERFVVVH